MVQLSAATTIDQVRQRQSAARSQREKRRYEGLNTAASVPEALEAFVDTAKRQGWIERSHAEPVTPNRLTASRIDVVGESSQLLVATARGTSTGVNLSLGWSQNPLLVVGSFALRFAQQLVSNFAALGINGIYPWQSSCLLGRGLLARERNLVYTAPTGGGKSLVADVLMLKKVIEHPSKKAILVLPYVALVQEEMQWLRKVVDRVTKCAPAATVESTPPVWQKPHIDSVRVAAFFGDSKTKVKWVDFDIAVCTFERVSAITLSDVDD